MSIKGSLQEGAVSVLDDIEIQEVLLKADFRTIINEDMDDVVFFQTAKGVDIDEVIPKASKKMGVLFAVSG